MRQIWGLIALGRSEGTGINQKYFEKGPSNPMTLRPSKIQ